MGLKDDIAGRVDEQLVANYSVVDAMAVPSRTSVTFGATAKKLFCRVVYCDIRGSQGIVSKGGPLDGLKVHKAFLYAVAKCIRAEGGEPRSFGGDSVLSFFAGSDNGVAASAVRGAMKMRWALDEIVSPKVSAKYGVALDYGIGIGQGDVYVGKSGLAGDEDFQDLLWIGWPVYYAVAYGDKASKPYALWISNNIWSAIEGDRTLTHSNNQPMWVYADESIEALGTVRVYKTTYRWSLE